MAGQVIVEVLTSGDAGGGQFVSVAIGRALAERGRAVRFVSPSTGSVVSHISDEFEVDIIPENSLRDLPVVHRIARYLKSVDAGVVHTHTPIAATILWRIGAAIARVPIIHHYHAANWYGPPGLKSFLARRIDLATRSVPRMNIAVSENTRARLIESGYARDRVATIYNGMRFPQRVRRRTRSTREPVIACVGRLAPPKGQRELLDAFQRVHSEWPGAKLWIIGSASAPDAEYERSLRKQCSACSLDNAVSFWGFRNDVDDLLEQSDLLVLPSHDEAFPLVLLEAMAKGLPVIATDVGGVRELVRNGETGVLLNGVEPDKLAGAILEILESPERAEELSKAAYEYVWARFDNAATLAPTLQALEREMRADRD